MAPKRGVTPMRATSPRGKEGFPSTQTGGEQRSASHGVPKNGRARFLLWVGRRRDRVPDFDPALDELGELYKRWKGDDTEQTDLEGWST